MLFRLNKCDFDFKQLSCFFDLTCDFDFKQLSCFFDLTNCDFYFKQLSFFFDLTIILTKFLLFFQVNEFKATGKIRDFDDLTARAHLDSADLP